jgi:Competence protein
MMSIVDRRHAGPASSDDAQCSSRRPAILVVAPESLFDPSFEMSFAAVVGLVALYEWLSKRRREQLSDVSPAWQALRRGWALAAGAALTTLVAGTAIAPFAVYHFHRMTHYGLFANLVAAPRQLFDHADGDVEPGRNAVRPRSVAAPRHGLRHRSDGCNGTMGGVLARRRLDPTAHFRHRPGPGRVGDVVGLSLADADARLA